VDRLLGLFGPLSVAIALAVMGLLSRRLGGQTHAKPYHYAFFAAAVLVAISIAAQFLDIVFQFPHDSEALWLILDDGLPAIAVTVGVISAWRYWSWLLAERD
jgi:hypothetical protein